MNDDFNSSLNAYHSTVQPRSYVFKYLWMCLELLRAGFLYSHKSSKYRIDALFKAQSICLANYLVPFFFIRLHDSIESKVDVSKYKTPK